jgi:hypothetical protein
VKRGAEVGAKDIYMLGKEYSVRVKIANMATLQNVYFWQI